MADQAIRRPNVLPDENEICPAGAVLRLSAFEGEARIACPLWSDPAIDDNDDVQNVYVGLAG